MPITKRKFLPTAVATFCLWFVSVTELRLGCSEGLLKLRPTLTWMGLSFATFIQAMDASAGTFSVEPVELPALESASGIVRAHTQGLEFAGGFVWVTARRDLPEPRGPLLLRTSLGARNWDVWNLTSSESPALDHPGGIQSDGRRLWIPLAESRPQGRSLIRAYVLEDLRPGQLPKPTVEFAVEDHIGALAVWPEQSKLVGATWDTDSVYVWDLTGKLLQTLNGADLRRRGLGAGMKLDETPGLAVQDWKFVNGALVASGLVKSSASASSSALSRLLWFDSKLEPKPSFPPLPEVAGDLLLAREGMAVANGFVYFLPGDLGATNRMYKMPWMTFRDAACDCN
ncbi:MAG TPA: DUF6454 family protein [Verrucomicrobiota bacterium]|nr:hypothetical protein [Verrucomicrobiales bacterium]HRI15473.1 DUF6454 family protein [Verrucomicrobiota bacterium]